MERRKRTTTPGRRRASTRDVLAPESGPLRIRGKWRKHYHRLMDLLGQLQHHRADLQKDALEERPEFSSHMADAGTDNYDRDWALGMLSSEQDAVYEIEEALERIRSGSYGRCELTGKPIEPGRLEAIPWTRFSLAAEKEVEKQGGAGRARLGPRETVTRISTNSAPGDAD